MPPTDKGKSSDTFRQATYNVKNIHLTSFHVMPIVIAFLYLEIMSALLSLKSRQYVERHMSKDNNSSHMLFHVHTQKKQYMHQKRGIMCDFPIFHIFVYCVISSFVHYTFLSDSVIFLIHLLHQSSHTLCIVVGVAQSLVVLCGFLYRCHFVVFHF